MVLKMLENIRLELDANSCVVMEEQKFKYGKIEMTEQKQQ
jgi:hypothetical protein